MSSLPLLYPTFENSILKLLLLLFRLVLGTLYPAYRSYKAIKNKDLREHVKWMMYWIVFALFTTAETFLDIFFSWFPFYYEIKILFILWVLSPATRGSSLLYKKLVHPLLISREKEIDDLIEKTKQQGYSTFIQLFTSGFNYASNLFLTSALKGQMLLGNQLKKSLSLNDVFGEISSNQNQNSSSSSSTRHHSIRNAGGNTINEEEYSDDYSDNNNRPIRKQTNNNKNKINNKTSYELIDDDILSFTDDSTNNDIVTARKPPTAPPATITTTATTTKKRSNSKQPNKEQQQQQHNSTAQISSYKSNEVSINSFIFSTFH